MKEWNEFYKKGCSEGSLLRCSDCINYEKMCLANENIFHYMQVFRCVSSKEHCTICKDFIPRFKDNKNHSTTKMWIDFENYVEWLREYISEESRSGIKIQDDDPYINSPYNVSLIQDNTAYSIRPYDWMYKQYTDENGKINKYVRKTKLKSKDINYNLVRNEHNYKNI